MVRSPFLSAVATLAMVSALFITSCGNNAQQDTAHATGAVRKVLNKSIQEAFVTAAAPAQPVSSPAAWHGDDGQHWVVGASEQNNSLIVYDAVTGELVKTVGTSGTAEGQFRQPCGISIVDNIAVVVERGNHRAQVFLLPDFRSLGFFGNDELVSPNGITMYQLFEDRYYIFVSDDAGKSAKIHKYEMNYFEGDFRSAHANTFGDTEGEGAITTPGSIYMDPLNNHLLVADIAEGKNNIKVYNVDGKFTGKVINGELFKNRPDGIALFEGQGSTGYWIVTDRHDGDNVFHVLNRQTFEQEASFKGGKVDGCTGLCVTDVPFGKFKKGALFTVNAEGKVAAFSWESLITGLNLDDVSQNVAML